MKQLTCNTCGGELSLDEAGNLGNCEHCGNVFLFAGDRLSKEADVSNINNLLLRAKSFLDNYEFEKALEYVEKAKDIDISNETIYEMEDTIMKARRNFISAADAQTAIEREQRKKILEKQAEEKRKFDEAERMKAINAQTKKLSYEHLKGVWQLDGERKYYYFFEFSNLQYFSYVSIAGMNYNNQLYCYYIEEEKLFFRQVRVLYTDFTTSSKTSSAGTTHHFETKKMMESSFNMMDELFEYMENMTDLSKSMSKMSSQIKNNFQSFDLFNQFDDVSSSESKDPTWVISDEEMKKNRQLNAMFFERMVPVSGGVIVSDTFMVEKQEGPFAAKSICKRVEGKQLADELRQELRKYSEVLPKFKEYRYLDVNNSFMNEINALQQQIAGWEKEVSKIRSIFYQWVIICVFDVFYGLVIFPLYNTLTFVFLLPVAVTCIPAMIYGAFGKFTILKRQVPLDQNIAAAEQKKESLQQEMEQTMMDLQRIW